MIASWQATLDALEAQQDSYPSIASAVGPEMAELKAKIGYTANALAPVSSLPVETLAVIFEMTTSDSTYNWEHHIALEISVSHVSAHWRHVALTRPSLWTNIRITFPHPSPWFEIYSLRSQQTLVNLRVELYESELSQPFGVLDEIIGRARRLEIVGDTCESFVPLCHHWESLSPPALEHLFLGVETGQKLGPPLLGTLFTQAPLLRTLEHHALGITTCATPASEVTNLRIIHTPGSQWVPYLNFRDALESFRCLTYLYLEGEYISHTWPRNPTSMSHRLRLPNLTHLHIKSDRCPEDDPVAGILINLYAPLLTNLILDTSDDDIAPFLAYNHESAYSSVQHLTISAAAFKNMSLLVSLARRFPAVTWLDLGPIESSHLHDIFCGPPNHTGLSEWVPVWEYLDTLTIRGQLDRSQYNPYTNFHALRDVVSTRRQAGHPIQNLRLPHNWENEFVGNTDIYDSIRAQGCVIELAIDEIPEWAFSRT